MVSLTSSWILFTTILWHTPLPIISNSVPATISPEGELYDTLALDAFYVDKTLMIEEFFTCLPENEYHLITQPPKYGKSTVLKMIKRFVEVELDREGYVPRQKNCTTAQILFERFKISQNKEIMNRHLAQYPVIYIDFNFQDSGVLPSKERALASLREKISVCFKRYYWLYEHLLKTHPHVDLDDVEFMKQAMDGNLSQPELARSLRKLAELLHSHFREKVIVLIDDYDKSIHNATFKPATWKDYAFNAFRLTDLVFQIIYKVLHDGRAHVRHALITGVSTMPAQCTSFKIDTLAHWGFLDEHNFNQYYGFTQFEVNELLDKYLVDEHQRSLVRIYYNGFHMIEPYSTRIYRPESIVCYLRTRLQDSQTALRSYWNETEIASFRVQFLNSHQLRQKLITNMANRSAGITLIPAQHLRSFQASSVHELMNLTCQKFQNFTTTQVAIISKYLFENGYLYYDSQTNYFYIANRETEQILVEKITQYYTEIVHIDNFHSVGRHLVTMLNNVTSQDDEIVHQFKIDLQNAFQKHFDRRPDLTSMNYDYDPPREFIDLECQSMVFMMAKVQPDINVKGKITRQAYSIETILMNSQYQIMIIRTKYKANLTEIKKQVVNQTPQLKKILIVNLNEQFQVEINLQIVQ